MTENQPRLVSYERRSEYVINRQDSGRSRDNRGGGYSQTSSNNSPVPMGSGHFNQRHHSNAVAPMGNSRIDQRMYVNGVEDTQFQRRIPGYAEYYEGQTAQGSDYHPEPGPGRYNYNNHRSSNFDHNQEPVDGHPHYGFPTSTSRAFPGEPQETDILDDNSDAVSDMYKPGTYAGNDDESTSESEIDDPEFIEIQERENIIKKYQEGPESKNIDDWENPHSSLYTNKDRFGFLHKDATGLTELEELTRRRVETEVRRDKKWRRMLEQWVELRKKGDRSRPKKLEERVWKGVPDKWRMKIWPMLLDIEQYRRKDLYNELLLRARLVSKDIKQIDLDINRTYRDHEVFRRRYDVKQRSLLNVLAAYAMYNTEVGYCQGMSQIAALFLMYLDEEETFWCLHALMVNPRHTMHGFFVPGFPKLTRFEEHFKKVLKKYRSRVYKHLDKQDIPYIYLTKWWFGCFLDRVPFSLALRLWDVFLIEGDSILIAMAYNIMKMHEKRILKLQIDTFMDFIQIQLANDFGFSDDETLISLRETLTKMKSDRLHIPPPPKESDLPERPTKALGPVLNKSMATIREELAEIQSRHSLAVSNGRSPYSGRKKSKSRAGSHSVLNASMNKLAIADDPPHHRANSDSHVWKGQQPEHPVPFEVPQRRASQKSRPHDGRPPPAVPPNKVQNGYKNYDSDRALLGRTSSVAVRDEMTGKTVTIMRGDDDDELPLMHRRDISTSSTARVTQSVNHVTYITLGDE